MLSIEQYYTKVVVGVRCKTVCFDKQMKHKFTLVLVECWLMN